MGYTGNAASIDGEAVVKAIGEIEGVEGKKGERVLGSKLIEAIGTTKIKFAQWVKKNKVGIKAAKKEGTSNTYPITKSGLTIRNPSGTSQEDV